MQLLKICHTMTTTPFETLIFTAIEPKSTSPRFMAFLRPAYCKPAMI